MDARAIQPLCDGPVIMRYQPLAATTTALCEGCGRRVPHDQLWFPSPVDQVQLAMGNAYHFTASRSLLGGVEVVVDQIFHTVCSLGCYQQAMAEKAPRVVAEIQRTSLDDKGLRGHVRAAVRI